MTKNILIINYNTPHLVECLVRSINLFVKDAIIYVFDNSDKEPFVNSFENVTVFDNTNGAIINFDEWLKKYPNRGKSHGRVNDFGSAKHCLTVDKAMDLIGENFVLLDSDTLLKRDISDLFDDEMIYCGETVLQPSSSIERILPFVCFINVEMCREYGIRYFDDNYMHGLWKNGVADRYDTGAGFKINTKGHPHKDIKCSDYVLHYGHGSWKKNGYKPQLSIGEWLSLNKKYWSSDKNKKVVYTCIVGDYDTLLEPRFISNGFDYVCFTDSKSFTSGVWDIRPLPKEVEELPLVKKQRWIKINAHKVLSDYDLSIWVDGSIQIQGDLNKFVEESVMDGCSIYIPQHPSRKCIYEEAKAVLSLRKDKAEIVNPQMSRYKADGFPSGYGCPQSNIILRYHNAEDCRRLMEAWFEEIRNGSHRDQLSFNYALWKNDDVVVKYLSKKTCFSDFFHWNAGHHGPKKTSSSSRKVVFPIRTL